MGLIILLAWVIVVAVFIVFGVSITSPVIFLIGILLLVVPFIIGECKKSKTSKGRREKYNNRKIQEEIEREFGLIEYWEDKDK